jgi:hypothetical protein
MFIQDDLYFWEDFAREVMLFNVGIHYSHDVTEVAGVRNDWAGSYDNPPID